jgi:transcriptional regulator of acetoin/glycerol metabolism
VKALTEAAGSARHATLLSSPDGTLLDLRGDDESLNGPEAMPPPGAMLAESTAGSNGIGTALIERKYVEIYGPEHFIAGFHDHLCLGLPLRGTQGELAGALCLSVREADTASNLRSLFFAVARGIESELRAESMRIRVRQLCEAPSRAAQSIISLHEEVERSRARARHLIARSVEALLAGETTRCDDLARDDVSEQLQSARESLERYLRSARTWQLASGLNLAEPMSIAELAANVVELMQNEASLLRVRLELANHPEAGVSFSNSLLVRLVLAETTQAIRSVGPKGHVVLGVASDGALGLSSQAADGSLRIQRRLPGRIAA